MKIDVKHVAKLANLTLSDDEIKTLGPQLESTVEYIERLNEIDTSGIEPTSQVTGLENVTRDDELRKSLSQDDALFNAKSKNNGMFKVDAILDNE